MSESLEREIKLRFASPAEARSAVLATGATPTRARRLQQDYLLDTTDTALQRQRSTLRVRLDAGDCRITFKGPPVPSIMKVREEIETTVGDGRTLLAVLERVGLYLTFRYEKYREEFAAHEVVIAIDETPVGTFVELEGSERGIKAVAARLGRAPADYVTASYRTLFLQHRQSHGLAGTHMTFDGTP